MRSELFGEATCLLVEGGCGFRGGGVGGLVEVVGDLEDAGNVGGQSGGELVTMLLQSMAPEPGQRCSSRMPLLSWRWSWRCGA